MSTGSKYESDSLSRFCIVLRLEFRVQTEACNVDCFNPAYFGCIDIKTGGKLHQMFSCEDLTTHCSATFSAYYTEVQEVIVLTSTHL